MPADSFFILVYMYTQYTSLSPICKFRAFSVLCALFSVLLRTPFLPCYCPCFCFYFAMFCPVFCSTSTPFLPSLFPCFYFCLIYALFSALLIYPVSAVSVLFLSMFLFCLCPYFCSVPTLFSGTASVSQLCPFQCPSAAWLITFSPTVHIIGGCLQLHSHRKHTTRNEFCRVPFSRCSL